MGHVIAKPESLIAYALVSVFDFPPTCPKMSCFLRTLPKFQL